MRIIAGVAALPHALNALPTAAVVAVVCALVIAEIVALPGVLLPGRTITLLAGALIRSGRPALGIGVPVAMAVIGGDHLAYRTGSAVTRWWHRRRGRAGAGGGGRHDQVAAGERGARGRAAGWLTAAMPSLAGAAWMPYRRFAPRLLVMRLPWLAELLTLGALAARSVAAVGHIAGIAGLAATAAALASLPRGWPGCCWPRRWRAGCVAGSCRTPRRARRPFISTR